MRTNLSIKVLSLLLAGVMAFGLASCKDDELEPEIDGPEVNIPLPTEDEVKTIVNKSYAVIGAGFDEVTPYILKRMTGKRYDYAPSDTYLADDVEVVFIGQTELMDISEEMYYQIKKVFDRGGAVYLHKPVSLAALFFDLMLNDELEDFLKWLQEDMNKPETRAEADDDVPYGRDCYILTRNGLLDMADIYDGKEFTYEATITEVDENGKEHTQTVTESFTPGEPTDYEYGLFAESVAQWMNGKPVTRAGNEADLKMPYEKHIVVPCKQQRRGDNKVLTASGDIIIRAASFYAPEMDEDFYYVTMEQRVPVAPFYHGEYYVSNKGEIRRARGYTYKSTHVNRPIIDEIGHQVTLSNLQPFPNTSIAQTISVEGWPAGTVIYKDDHSIGTLESVYRPEILALPPEERHDMFNFRGEQKYPGWPYENFWDFRSSARENYKNNFLDPSHPNCKDDAITRQSFICKITDTKKRGATPFLMKLYNYFGFTMAWMKKDGGLTYPNTWDGCPYYGTLYVELPVPNRVVGRYEISAKGDKWSDDWKKVEAFLNTSPAYHDIVENQYCGTHREQLDRMMMDRWTAMREELAKNQAALPKLTQTYEVNLLSVYDVGTQIGPTLHIGPDGISICRVGSYFMSDGRFLTPETKLTEEQKKECVGIVCFVSSSDKWGSGINGYAMALHDANDTPSDWGNTDIFSSRPGANYTGDIWGGLGRGYQNTNDIKKIADRKGMTINEQDFPAMHYAIRYSVPLPPGAKGWFLPSCAELMSAAWVDKESFENAGGEHFNPERRYAGCDVTCELNLGEGIYDPAKVGSMYWQGPIDTDWRTESVENTGKYKFHVRPFIAF
ncbi:hypothetical protein [Bacteroides rodentium]|uniref:hypothetical protein n=1 Tax=Bacteroides rodentium TaxID=691816 RepID=UPI0004728748|nr:hypothetical protein [Bacteroides rodentium]